MAPLSLPADYTRIKLVASFDELLSTRFGDGVNALCWPRTLDGDFGEVVRQLGAGEGIVTLEDALLRALDLSPAGQLARDAMLQDQELLRARALDPVLNCIHAYPRDEEGGPVPTDVFSFHADSATTEADTWLCTYYGTASEGLRNEEARRKIDVPEIRAQLLNDFGGEDDEGFVSYLEENCFNLHYAPQPGATPFPFGRHHLWRIATDYPGSPVPPCIHRAPATLVGDSPRLLLIS